MSQFKQLNQNGMCSCNVGGKDVIVCIRKEKTEVNVWKRNDKQNRKKERK